MNLSIPDADNLDELVQVASLLDLATGWYEPWYFRVRLEEEIVRLQRYGQEASLIHIDLPPSARTAGDEVWTVREQLAEIAFEGLRASDLPGKLGDLSYALLLPATPRDGAAIVAERLEEQLRQFAPAIGILSLPKEADLALQLCNSASVALKAAKR